MRVVFPRTASKVSEQQVKMGETLLNSPSGLGIEKGKEQSVSRDGVGCDNTSKGMEKVVGISMACCKEIP